MTSNAAMPRHPQKPASLLSAIWGDFALTILFVALAGLSDGHAAVAIAVFFATSVTYEILGITAHRRAESTAALHYEFGAGKLHQALNLVLAMVMIATSLWLATHVIGSITTTGPVTAQHHLLMTAMAGALCLLRFASDWLSALFVSRRKQTNVRHSSLKSTASRFFIMLFVQSAVTISAVTRDPLIVLWAQTAATGLIALALMLSGINMLRNAILDLIDHPLDQLTQAAIIEHIKTGQFMSEQVEDVRMRRAGPQLFVELTVTADATRPLTETLQEMSGLRQHLQSRLDNVDVSIKLA